MLHGYPSFRGSSAGGFEAPIELRFVDLFMILLTALIFITVVLSLFSAFGGRGEEVHPPEIMTAAVPDAIAARPYRVMLAAMGGSGGYKWAESGKLPMGLALNPEGVIDGTPRAAGSSGVDLSVTDQSGRSATARLRISVLPPVGKPVKPENRFRVLLPAAIPGAIQNRDYRTKLEVEGGMAPYTWKARGRLPQGLMLFQDGVVSGKPAESKVGRPYAFDVEISDALGEKMIQQMQLWVDPEPPSRWKTAFSWIIGWIFIAFWIFYFIVGGYFPGLKGILESRRNRSSGHRY